MFLHWFTRSTYDALTEVGPHPLATKKCKGSHRDSLAQVRLGLPRTEVSRCRLHSLAHKIVQLAFAFKIFNFLPISRRATPLHQTGNVPATHISEILEEVNFQRAISWTVYERENLLNRTSSMSPHRSVPLNPETLGCTR
jgi:hypothetical protein